MNEPLVSVIMPCYNQANYLQEAVDSVLNSSYKNIEIIIVNDGSTDPQSIQILNKFKAPKSKLIHQKNKGVIIARNVAVENSQGKYILPLDSDDKIHPEYIKKSVSVLEQNENIGIVGCITELFGKKQGLFDFPKYKFPDILKGNVLVASCMFRKEDWQKVGGYNPNMIYGLEDWDFWLSIIKTGKNVFQFDEVLFYYRQNDVSRTTKLNCSYKAKMLFQIIQNHIDLYSKYPGELKSILNLISETLDWYVKKTKKVKKQRKLYLYMLILIVLYCFRENFIAFLFELINYF